MINISFSKLQCGICEIVTLGKISNLYFNCECILSPTVESNIRFVYLKPWVPQRALTAPFRASPLCSVTFKLNSCYNILISLTHTQFVIAVLLRNMYYRQRETFWLSCSGWVYPCEYRCLTLCNLFCSLFNRGQLFVLRKWDNELLRSEYNESHFRVEIECLAYWHLSWIT